MTNRLEDRCAIVTGAGAGIGEAIAHKFAREGANLVLAGLPADPLDEVARAIGEQYPSSRVVVWRGDLGNEEEAEACVKAAIKEFDKLDILVNNAGTIPELNETPEFSTEAFETLIQTNVRSVFFCTRAALPYLQKSRGCVISAGSEAGLNGSPKFTAYGATKAWIHGFMKGVAVEQAKYGVRANCVCPGPIDTEMTRPEHGQMDEKTAKMVTASTPLGRRGTPEEMANVYAFLASDEASYVTGALFVADGGITLAHGNVGDQAEDHVKEQPAGVLKLSHAHDGQRSPKTHT